MLSCTVEIKRQQLQRIETRFSLTGLPFNKSLLTRDGRRELPFFIGRLSLLTKFGPCIGSPDAEKLPQMLWKLQLLLIKSKYRANFRTSLHQRPPYHHRPKLVHWLRLREHWSQLRALVDRFLREHRKSLVRFQRNAHSHRALLQNRL